jgi:uncharacterized protein YwbE
MERCGGEKQDGKQGLFGAGEVADIRGSGVMHPHAGVALG